MILGTQWKNESSENKSHYINLARRLKAKHLEEHPGYHYQPRKSSEKKRRLSRRTTITPNSITTSASNTNPGSTGVIGTSDNTASANADDGVTTMIRLPRTAEGNIVLELGDSSIGDDELRRLLEQHNSQVAVFNAQAVANVPAAVATQPVNPAINNNPIARFVANTPPVLYQEPTAESQDDDNFFAAFVDYEAYLEDIDVAEEIAHKMSQRIGYDTPKATAAYDAADAQFATAEMSRQARLEKESATQKLATLEAKIKLGLKVDVNMDQVREEARLASEYLEYLEANGPTSLADTLALLSRDTTDVDVVNDLNGQDET